MRRQIKRKHSENRNHLAKKKTIEENTRHFEDLSNDLIYEIFEYLDYFDIYQSFFNINHRFHHLLINSNFPIKINISSIPKCSFQPFYNHIIENNLHRIQSIGISTVCSYDYLFLTIPNLSKITGLKTLILDQIESKYLINLLDQLQCSTSLSSLTITIIDVSANKTEILTQLFCLSTLKFCKLSFYEYSSVDLQLPMAMINQQSTIEHFIMTNIIYLHQIDNLLSYLPQLSRLSLHLIEGNQRTQSSIVLNQLTHLSIENNNIKFDDFVQMIIDLFSNIQVLNFTHINYSNIDQSYLNAKKWKQFITSHLKNLHSFNIQLNSNLQTTDYDNQFTTLFWIKRQWFITHEICSLSNRNYLNLYSIKPYRNKMYTLCKSFDNNTSIYNDKTNLNLVQHVRIENKRGLLESVYRFPNVTELTFGEHFSANSLSFITILNNILPLKQLTKLVIGCGRFSLKKVMELIKLAPNLHTLKWPSILLYNDNHESIQKSELFQLVSKTNNIKHIIYTDICKLENLQLIITLFSRIEQLTINTYADDLQVTVWFLLDNTNEYTRHLRSLNFTSASVIWAKKLKRLFQVKPLIHDYTLKFINHKLYLTW